MGRLGVITIGQSPRSDMLPEMTIHWPDVEVVESGALDGLTGEVVSAEAIRDGDEVLTSRLRDGTSVVFGRDLVLPRLQAAITALEDNGADAVLLVCTGEFPPFTHRRPLFLASPLLVKGVQALADGPVGVISPLPEQQADSVRKFAGVEVLTAAANPYGADPLDLEQAAQSLFDRGATLLVLDCMGYSEADRAVVRRAVPDVPVVVARSLVARLVAEAVAA